MRKFLLFGKEGLACSLAYKLMLEGEEVGYCITDKASREHLDGMGIEKFSSMTDALRWAGRGAYLVCDDEADVSPMRKDGWKVFGGNRFTERMENDRAFEGEVAKAAGVPIPNFHEAKSIDEAIAFIHRHPDAWCIKQLGHAPKEFGYVGKDDDGADTLLQLKWIKQHPLAKEMQTFLLQEKVEGLEFAIGAFWMGHDWLRRDDGTIFLNANREHKKMLHGDLGMGCGEMGTVMTITDNMKLFEIMLEPLTDTLLFSCPDVVLPIDANCGIVNEDEAWLYEWTPRLGYPAHTLIEGLLDMPVGEFYANLIDKRQGEIQYKPGWCVGTVIGCGDFPHEAVEDVSHTFKNQPVKAEWSESVLPEYIKHDEQDDIDRVADDYSWVGTVVQVDDDIAKANEGCVEAMSEIEVRAPVYRKDVGDKFAKEELPQLRKWGWL